MNSTIAQADGKEKYEMLCPAIDKIYGGILGQAVDPVSRRRRCGFDQRRGLLEVEQVDPPRVSRMGIYLLAERRDDERLQDLVRRIIAAATPVLPPLV